MPTHSPILLAYPQLEFESSPSGTRIVGTASASAGEGVYNSPPSVENIDTGTICNMIPIGGYSELYVYPVSIGDDAPTFYVYGVYASSQGGHGTSKQYVVKMLYSFTTANILGTTKTWTSEKGTVYKTKGISYTGSFQVVLDSIIGCQSQAQTGSATVLGNVGTAHAGGADYLIITWGSSVENGDVNAYVWMN